MTGPLLIAIGFLSMAFLATFLRAESSSKEFDETQSRRRILKELERIELHHPERIVE